MSATLFVVCLLANALFGLFCGIFICKYVSRMFVVALSRLIAQTQFVC